MYYIRFKTQSITSSFRDINFKSYHRSYLAPTRTNIIGLLTNIACESEEDYYLNLKTEIKVSVVIESIAGSLNDLWTYKTLKDSNRGKSIIRRSKNFKPIYTVYLQLPNAQIINKIETILLNPRRIPSLGMDDDLVSISEVKKIDLEEREFDEVHSTTPFQSGNDGILNSSIDTDLSKNKYIINPVDNYIYRDFILSTSKTNRRGVRFGSDPIYIREFYNCHLKLNSSIQVYFDNEKKYSLLFH